MKLYYLPGSHPGRWLKNTLIFAAQKIAGHLEKLKRENNFIYGQIVDDVPGDMTDEILELRGQVSRLTKAVEHARALLQARLMGGEPVDKEPVRLESVRHLLAGALDQ